MMNGMMGSGMIWGLGLFGLAVLVLLVLAVAAVAKYLFFDGRTKGSSENSESAMAGHSPGQAHLANHENNDGGSSPRSSKGPRS